MEIEIVLFFVLKIGFIWGVDKDVESHEDKIINYTVNTPFSNEQELENFIRHVWRDYPMFNKSSLTETFKEMIYTSFNLNKTTVRVCNDLSYPAYQEKLAGVFSNEQVFIITSHLALLPLEYFKWSLELMTILSENDGYRAEMFNAVKNLNKSSSVDDFEALRPLKNNQATVIIPYLFKSNYSVISPVIVRCFPILSKISVVKIGEIFFRYEYIKNTLNDTESWPNFSKMLQNIPVFNDEQIPFENFCAIVDSFQKNISLLYVTGEKRGHYLDEKPIPLSHWTFIYNVLNTDVNEYLQKLMSANGSLEYDRLPWIDYENEQLEDNIVSSSFLGNSSTDSRSLVDYRRFFHLNDDYKGNCNETNEHTESYNLNYTKLICNPDLSNEEFGRSLCKENEITGVVRSVNSMNQNETNDNAAKADNHKYNMKSICDSTIDQFHEDVDDLEANCYPGNAVWPHLPYHSQGFRKHDGKLKPIATSKLDTKYTAVLQRSSEPKDDIVGSYRSHKPYKNKISEKSEKKIKHDLNELYEYMDHLFMNRKNRRISLQKKLASSEDNNYRRSHQNSLLIPSHRFKFKTYN